MFVSKVRIKNIPALAQIMVWCLPGDKPLFEPMMVNLLAHICITRAHWVSFYIIASIFVHHLIIITRLEVWIIISCLGVGHAKIIYAACLPIFLWICDTARYASCDISCPGGNGTEIVHVSNMNIHQHLSNYHIDRYEVYFKIPGANYYIVHLCRQINATVMNLLSISIKLLSNDRRRFFGYKETCFLLVLAYLWLNFLVSSVGVYHTYNVQLVSFHRINSRCPFYWHGANLIPGWASNDILNRVWDVILIHSQAPTVAPLMFGNA